MVRGNAKALCGGVIPATEQSKNLSVIEQKAEGLDQLINTFYEYSKLKHHEYVLTLREVGRWTTSSTTWSSTTGGNYPAIRTGDGRKSVWIRVVDSGIGIPRQKIVVGEAIINHW